MLHLHNSLCLCCLCKYEVLSISLHHDSFIDINSKCEESLEFTSNSEIDGNYTSAYKYYHSDLSVALSAGDQNLSLAQILPGYPNLVSRELIKTIEYMQLNIQA